VRDPAAGILTLDDGDSTVSLCWITVLTMEAFALLKFMELTALFRGYLVMKAGFIHE
jgi:hypothetical protein